MDNCKTKNLLELNTLNLIDDTMHISPPYEDRNTRDLLIAHLYVMNWSNMIINLVKNRVYSQKQSPVKSLHEYLSKYFVKFYRQPFIQHRLHNNVTHNDHTFYFFVGILWTTAYEQMFLWDTRQRQLQQLAFTFQQGNSR